MKKCLSIVLILVLVLSLFMFVACDSQADTKTKIIVKVPALSMDISNIAGEEIESVADFLEIMASVYMANHDDVEIEIAEYESTKEKMFVEDAIGTASSPDVLFDSFYNMRSYIYSGKVIPIDKQVTTIQNSKIENTALEFNEDALNAGQIDNKQYMLPFYSQQTCLAYNWQKITDFLATIKNPAATEITYEDNGLEKKIAITGEEKTIASNLYNKFPGKVEAKEQIINFTNEDWDNLYTLWGKFNIISPDTQLQFMYAQNQQGDEHIMTLLKAYGATIVEDGAVVFDDTATKTALKKIDDNRKNKCYPSKAENFDINDCVELFLNNQLVFSICNNSLYRQYEKVSFGLINFPGGTNGYCENMYYGFELFNNGSVEKVELAKKFIEFIYTGYEDNGQKANIRYSACGIPAIKYVEDKYKENNYITKYSMFNANLSNVLGGVKDTYSYIAPGITNWNAVRREICAGIQELLRGSLTYEEVAAQIQERAEKVKDQNVKPPHN